MPASYTHQCFGDDLLRYMNSDHKTLIKQYKNLFNLGLQGPDLLFYYHPLKKNRVQDIGIKMHQLPARWLCLALLIGFKSTSGNQ